MSSCQTNNNLNEKHNRIRKRGGCSSSSSSSSLVPSYRFKRAIVVGKRGGSTTTPAPMWKTRTSSSHHLDQHIKEASLPSSASSGVPFKEKEVAVSARKLAATLWEIKDLHPSRVKKDITRSRDKAVGLRKSGLSQPHVSDPSDSPLSERMEGFEFECCKRRVSPSSHQHQLADYYLKGLDVNSNAKLMEVGNQPRNKKNCCKCTVGIKNHLKEARSGLSTTKKLLKVLNQKCLQEQHSSSIPLILAMSSELDRVRNQIDQLIQQQRSTPNDIEYLMKQFAEEKAAWKRREREKIHDAITSTREELEVEKKLRRQTERLNKKIAKEMACVKASYVKASEDLEREKRAKEILEQICDELARGIGEDRAQVEQLKMESDKVREEVEKEREMLQLADVLREERVQMKLSEAKYQFEEKNAVLEKLRDQIECLLRTNKEGEENGDVHPGLKKIKDFESYLNETCWEFQSPEMKENDFDVGDDEVELHEDDSADSDLQSIELNMDNDSKSCNWGYAFEIVAQDDSKRVSIDRDIGRKSFSERIQWGSICFNKGTGSCNKKNESSSDQCDRERSIEFLFGAKIQDDKEEAERYRIMSHQDCISCVNPPQGSGQPLTLQYIDGET